MIASYFSGRTGNQMFQYAFMRKLWEQRNKKEKIIFNFSLVNQRNDEKGYKDTFEDFSILPYSTDNRNLILNYGSFYQIITFFVYRFSRIFLNKNGSWFSLFRKIGLLYSEYWENDSLLFNASSKKIIIYGKFENSFFFNDIRTILQKEFTPKHEPLDSNLELYDIIKRSNSVCIHVRRGDFLSDEFRKDFYVCDEKYYIDAINLIFEKVDNPVFFFCSNDIDWVKKNIHVDAPCFYEPEGNPLWETFRMMYSCKHFIISNSTLSWWAQYLAENKDKIIISPDHWYNNPKKDIHARLLEDHFIKLPTEYHS